MAEGGLRTSRTEKMADHLIEGFLQDGRLRELPVYVGLYLSCLALSLPVLPPLKGVSCQKIAYGERPIPMARCMVKLVEYLVREVSLVEMLLLLVMNSRWMVVAMMKVTPAVVAAAGVGLTRDEPSCIVPTSLFRAAAAASTAAAVAVMVVIWRWLMRMRRSGGPAADLREGGGGRSPP